MVRFSCLVVGEVFMPCRGGGFHVLSLVRFSCLVVVRFSCLVVVRFSCLVVGEVFMPCRGEVLW